MAGAIAFLPACGLFNSSPYEEFVQYASEYQGCLNEFGPQFQKYLKGDVSHEEWESNWDCSIEALKLFRDFVRGSQPDGYDSSEIHTFLARFLVTNGKASFDLADSLFPLKSVLLGGNSKILLKSELDSFLDLMELGKKESLVLLPYLREFERHPSRQSLLKLSDAVEKTMNTLAQYYADRLAPLKGEDLKREDLKRFVDEFGKFLDWNLEYSLDDVILAGKKVLVSGSENLIERHKVSDLVKLVGKALGPYSAALKWEQFQQEKNEIVLDMGWTVREAFHVVFELHGGSVSLSLFDRLLDSLKEDWIPWKKEVLKQSLRPIAKNLLWAHRDEVLDQHAIHTAYGLLERWSKSQTYLEKIFEQYGLDENQVHTDDFVRSATAYLRQINEQGLESELRFVMPLITLGLEYRPLFAPDRNFIQYVPWLMNSLNHLTQLNWLNLLSEHLIQSYSASTNKRTLTFGDLSRFEGDFYDLAVELRVLDPDVPNFIEKRYREADLLVMASNGDGEVDLRELTYLATTLFSTAQRHKQILDFTQEPCSTGEVDSLNWFWMEVSCFRSLFYNNLHTFWDSAPDLLGYYNSLSESKRSEFRDIIEESGRRFGHTDLPVGGFDVSEGFSGIIHYIEGIFLRYDLNHDQKLDVEEVKGAFPTFRKIISEIGDIDYDERSKLEAVFTYIIKFGHPPETDLEGSLHFLWWWKVMKPFWKIDAYRRDIYKIITLFKVPEEPPQ